MRRMRSFVAVLLMAAFAVVVVEHTHVHAATHTTSRSAEACVFCSHTVVSGPAPLGLPAPVFRVEIAPRAVILTPILRARPSHLARGPPASVNV